MICVIDWNAVGVVLAGLGAVLVGVSAFVASNVWRRETVGKRKIELAEETLTLVYQAKDKIAYARNGASSAGEGEFENDIADEDRRAFAYAMNTPAKRLLDDAEFFGNLNSNKYLVQAYFGTDVREAIDDLLHIRHRVIVASQAVVRAILLNYIDLPNQREHIQRMENIMWDMVSSDEPEQLRNEVNNAVIKVEEKLGREITTASANLMSALLVIQKVSLP